MFGAAVLTHQLAQHVREHDGALAKLTQVGAVHLRRIQDLELTVGCILKTLKAMQVVCKKAQAKKAQAKKANSAAKPLKAKAMKAKAMKAKAMKATRSSF